MGVMRLSKDIFNMTLFAKKLFVGAPTGPGNIILQRSRNSIMVLKKGKLTDQAQLFQRLSNNEKSYTFKLIFNTLLTLAHP